MSAPAVHPAGSRARVLLSSVFGPYARDDEYGSRADNPMELYQNQVTRVQGVFSLRMFHRSWGLMLIQANLDAPCRLLDFPTLERFEQELRDHPYDVVGISAIQPNLEKARAMCSVVRRVRPQATVVVGGHVAGLPDAEDILDADHVVRGDGVRWFRRYLGEDEERPIRHPLIVSGFGTRSLGVSPREGRGDTAATLIPSVGCPLGCDFCATSAMFGGKGKVVHFYRTGDELFDLMRQLEGALGVRSFFVMDENFLLDRRRALRLLELMERHSRPWALYLFSSANALSLYTMDELVRLGVSWVWMGLEGKDSHYGKLRHADTRTLVRELQSHGIRVLGSSIVGLPEHTPESIDAAIDWAVEHDTDFHQFMLYTPVAGTPLHALHAARGTLLSREECPEADSHGQTRFNFRHDHIRDGREGDYLLAAFRRDFERNGPSLVRIVRTTLQLWRRHRAHPDPRVRERVAWEADGLSTRYAAVLWAAERWYPRSHPTRAAIARLRAELGRERGLLARLAGPVGGRYVLRAMRREAGRLAGGWTHEPPLHYETNEDLPAGTPGAPARCRWILPRPVEALHGLAVPEALPEPVG